MKYLFIILLLIISCSEKEENILEISYYENCDFIEEEIYEVDRKAAETRNFCTFELAASIDQFGVNVPKRQYLPDEFKGIGGFFN